MSLFLVIIATTAFLSRLSYDRVVCHKFSERERPGSKWILVNVTFYFPQSYRVLMLIKENKEKKIKQRNTLTKQVKLTLH